MTDSAYPAGPADAAPAPASDSTASPSADTTSPTGEKKPRRTRRAAPKAAPAEASAETAEQNEATAKPARKRAPRKTASDKAKPDAAAPGKTAQAEVAQPATAPVAPARPDAPRGAASGKSSDEAQAKTSDETPKAAPKAVDAPKTVTQATPPASAPTVSKTESPRQATAAPSPQHPAPHTSSSRTTASSVAAPQALAAGNTPPALEARERVSLTSHPVQVPAVTEGTLPAVSQSAVPALNGQDLSASSASPEEGSAPSRRRRSRRSGRRRRPEGEQPETTETVQMQAEAVPAAAPEAHSDTTELSAEADETDGNTAPKKNSRSRSRRRKPRAETPAVESVAQHAEEAAPHTEDAEELPESEESLEAGAEADDNAPRAPRKPRRRRNKKNAQAAIQEALDEEEDSEDDAKKVVSNVNRKMLVSVLPGDLVEVVLTEDGLVREYYVEMTHQAKIRGNIYKGVINNIDTNLQAAFVNYGNVKNGFLQIDEVHPEYYLQPHEETKGRKYPPIQKVLKPGQEVLVQVVKEPNGSKGAFLTTWLSLAGRFLVLTPGQEQIGISRKVEDGEERNRLRDLIRGLEPGEGLGAIVRTVSAGTSKTTLQKDLSFLKRVWKDIRKRATTEKVPSLIYQEPGLASRSVRDYLSDDVSEVWVDDAETAEAIREMASLLFPRKADLVHLYESQNRTLWEQFGVLSQIEQVHSREVIMPSGGRLVFDQTEALMAIDINSGKIGGKTNFESMAFRTNMEAATAIARQLRLRDIGGQIVIDFIEMRDQDHCREVEKELRNAMKGDRARHDIGKMSSFGLLQIVRQRTGSSAISISMEACPHCKGTGQRRNLEWQSVQALRDLKRSMRSAASAGQTEFQYSVDAELGLYLLNHKRERLSVLEKDLHLRLDIRITGVSPTPAPVIQPAQHGHHGSSHGR